MNFLRFLKYIKEQDFLLKYNLIVIVRSIYFCKFTSATHINGKDCDAIF